MSERPIPRLAAFSGIAAVALLFVGSAFSGGGSPDLDASRAKLVDWSTAHPATTSSYAGGMIELLGILAMIVFAATLWAALRRAEGGDGIFAASAFGAALISTAIKLASLPAVFAAVWRSRQGIDPQLAAALLDMNNAAFVLTWGIDAVMMAAAAVVILRSRALPHWLGWLGAITAAVSLVSMPLADVVPPLGILLTFAWIVATSVVLVRRPQVGVAHAVVAAA
jgi:hypothetical protein